MTKKELRELFKQKRSRLKEAEVEELSMVITQRILNEITVAHKNIHVFLPIKKFNEPDMFLLIKQLMVNGDHLYTSLSDKNSLTLSHVKFDSETKFREDDWGIPVPENAIPVEQVQFDIILVPLLCCDKNGHRVGYGKGFYDRFLLHQKKAKKIGISFFEPVEQISDVTVNDVELDMLITPDKNFVFGHV
jgi:5-formyltetrahydrofolate cyclo-ligase